MNVMGTFTQTWLVSAVNEGGTFMPVATTKVPDFVQPFAVVTVRVTRCVPVVVHVNDGFGKVEVPKPAKFQE